MVSGCSLVSAPVSVLLGYLWIQPHLCIPVTPFFPGLPSWPLSHGHLRPLLIHHHHCCRQMGSSGGGGETTEMWWNCCSSVEVMASTPTLSPALALTHLPRGQRRSPRKAKQDLALQSARNWVSKGGQAAPYHPTAHIIRPVKFKLSEQQWDMLSPVWTF